MTRQDLDRRLDEVLEILQKLARLDYSGKLEISKRVDGIDAIAAGINMLSEELNAQVIERSIYNKNNLELLEAMKLVAFYKKALDATSIVVITDAKGTIEYVNDKFCETSKYSREEFIGQNQRIVNSQYHSKTFWKTMWNTITKGDLWHGEIRNRSKDGEYYWVDTTVVPILDNKGRSIKYMAIGNEITEDKLQKQKLEKATLEAAEGIKAKEEFLSVMSHEIRTPLNSVIGLSDLLIRKTPRVDQKDILKSLKTSADNLKGLIDDILDYSKIQTNKVELENTNFDLYSFINKVYKKHELRAKDKGIDYMVTIDEKLPQFVKGDSIRLEQILNKLLCNAIKFTKVGSVAILVKCIARNREYVEIQFAIIDTGIGIKKDKIKSIFDPFSQTDKKITREHGGTGLGLSIAQNLIKIMGGEIKVMSDTSIGSIFTACVTLSLDDNTSYSEEDEIEDLEFDNVNILYAEDVSTNQFLIQNIMNELGIGCDIAKDGHEAIEKAKLVNYDVILMDVQMPGLDGFRATKQIRKLSNHKNTPIIAFTADLSENTQIDIFKSGMTDVLLKPLDLNRFITLLKKNIDTKKVRVNNNEIPFDIKYFEDILGKDQDKIAHFVQLLKKDVLKFKIEFLKAYEKNDFDLLRKEMHKMESIAAQLKFTKLLELFNEYRLLGRISENMESLNESLVKILDDFLNNDFNHH